MGKAFNYERAEQEANKIGLEFAHSNDVVKDMSRAYNVDFSNIKVHTDSAADNKVKAAGKDALAQGNDIFFGKGIFESSDPADKGLVAHEFAHTMQQGAAMGGEMAVAESAPMGVAQGGIGSWFKKLFGKKKTATPSQDLINAMAEDDFAGLNEIGPQNEPAMEDETEMPAVIQDGNMTFMSEDAQTLFGEVNRLTPEQLQQNPELIERIKQVYQTDMAKRLKLYNKSGYNTFLTDEMRLNSNGEQKMYNKLLQSTLPEGFATKIISSYTGNEKLDKPMQGMIKSIQANGPLMDLLNLQKGTFQTSAMFQGENAERASNLVMNNFLLRAAVPQLTGGMVSVEQSAFERAAKKVNNGVTKNISASDKEKINKAMSADKQYLKDKGAARFLPTTMQKEFKLAYEGGTDTVDKTILKEINAKRTDKVSSGKAVTEKTRKAFLNLLGK